LNYEKIKPAMEFVKNNFTYVNRAHELIKCLCLLNTNITFIYCSQENLDIPIDIYVNIQNNFPNIRQIIWYSIEEALSSSDVLYMTRIQKERIFDNNQYKPFSLNKDTIMYLNKDAIILHPLPRLEEISSDIDNDSRAVYFKQVENGVYMRMAILTKLLS
jgi:aspartate carbamoyltransferase catalytic subunit